jgi:nicotinate phosphoribosyltransferase
VYKLVEVNSDPRIKVSQDPDKLIIPCRKEIYRLYGGDENKPLVDLMQLEEESAPDPLNLPTKNGILIKHPFLASKRAYMKPTKVVKLLQKVFDGSTGEIAITSIEMARNRCQQQLQELRSDHKRVVNPTPYKVSVSSGLFDKTKEIWEKEMPVIELK